MHLLRHSKADMDDADALGGALVERGTGQIFQHIDSETKPGVIHPPTGLHLPTVSPL
jgi:hypothetical protein